MKTEKSIIVILLCLTVAAFVPNPLLAVAQAVIGAVEKHADAPVENRFVVGPTKIEANVPAGENKVVYVDLENRTGRTETFVATFEDFKASADANQTVELLGSEKGATSLKDYLSIPETSYTLFHGDRVRIPVTISIPAQETAGGKFGSVVVSAYPTTETENGEVKTGAVVVGRVASLLFVTVPGEIIHSANTESFRIAKNASVFFVAPVDFQVAYKNSGTTYENPYGGITIRNMFGTVVDTVQIDPWYVLPGATRTREVTFVQKNLFGFYTATLELNRGYENVIDTKEVSFLVLNPLTLILLALVILGLGALLKNRFARS